MLSHSQAARELAHFYSGQAGSRQFRDRSCVNQANEDNFSETKQEAERTLAAIGALMREYESHKSFYPEEIYESMLELQKLSWFQFVLQADRGNVMERNTAFKTAVDVLRKKSQSSDADGTSETIDKIYEAIRKRVQYWEDLQIT